MIAHESTHIGPAHTIVYFRPIKCISGKETKLPKKAPLGGIEPLVKKKMKNQLDKIEFKCYLNGVTYLSTIQYVYSVAILDSILPWMVQLAMSILEPGQYKSTTLIHIMKVLSDMKNKKNVLVDVTKFIYLAFCKIVLKILIRLENVNF